MRSLLLWKRDRILFLAAILASCRASWVCWWSKSSDIPELGVRLPTELQQGWRNKREQLLFITHA